MNVFKIIVTSFHKNKWENVNFPAGNYMFRVNNRDTRARCEICSGILIVNFEHISHLLLVFLLLTLSGWVPAGRRPAHEHIFLKRNFSGDFILQGWERFSACLATGCFLPLLGWKRGYWIFLGGVCVSPCLRILQYFCIICYMVTNWATIIDVFYTWYQVSLYLWWIKSLLKSLKF